MDKMRLRGLIRRDAEAGVYVSFCPALQLYSQGENEDEAEKALMSAIQLYVSSCYEKGILESRLKGNGFSLVARNDPADLIEAEYVSIEKVPFDRSFDFNVPLQLLGSQQPKPVCV